MNVRSLIVAGLTLAVALTVAPGFAAETSANPSSSTASPTPRVRRQRGPSIETLLNLAPDQKTRYQAIQSDFRAQMTALRASTLPTDQKTAKRKALNADRQRQIEGILNPDQLTQYTKIMADRRARGEAMAKARKLNPNAQTTAPVGATGMRLSGPRSPDAMIARMKETLNLTADQESKIRAIFQDSAQKRAQLQQTASATDADKAKLRSERQALGRETYSRVRGVLTPDQLVKFDQMRQRRPARTATPTNGGTAPESGAK